MLKPVDISTGSSREPLQMAKPIELQAVSVDCMPAHKSCDDMPLRMQQSLAAKNKVCRKEECHRG